MKRATIPVALLLLICAVIPGCGPQEDSTQGLGAEMRADEETVFTQDTSGADSIDGAPGDAVSAEEGAVSDSQKQALIPGGVVYFRNLGHIPGPRWLDGRTTTGTVGLAPNTGFPYTGTRWRVYRWADGTYSFQCLGTINGPRWLNGRTGNGTVGLAPSTGFPYTGTRWQVFSE
jgi:hypothetical protein